ncbi:MAG: pyridoxamine 5'-phosphate oxidase family protein [Acidimicrobiia bacterium]|nr:pyridoxamine 5'-phosphate oxidase family protein [Acidimicrobiia bacterium]
MSSIEPGTLSNGECWERLRSSTVGRIAYFDAHTGIEIFPVNYIVDHGTIVLRTAEGTKLTALASGPTVAFEVDGGDASTRSGWAVVIVGTAESIGTHDQLMDAFDLEVTTWHGSSKPFFLRVVPNDVRGDRARSGEAPITSPRKLHDS